MLYPRVMNEISDPRRVRGLILDRDGIINVDTHYLSRIEDCVFVEGIFPLLQRFSADGFRLAIATNQSGIARGYFTEADFDRLMAWMRGEFAKHGITIDAIYHSPYHPTEGIGDYRRDSDCRKPKPGMFLQAIADLSLDPATSWAIGDSEHDMVAAQSAGIGHRVLLNPAHSQHRRDDGVWIVPTLSAIHALIDPAS